MKLKNYLAAGAAIMATSTAFVTLPTPVMAQQITSEIRGTVTDNSGAPISGASVTVIDTRTGSTRNVTTDGTGRFSVRNLQPGGPYTVSVSSATYQGESITDVSTSIASATSLAFGLAPAGAVEDEIVVTASRSNVAQVAIGPSATFDLETIESLPSISRDIRDIIRVDPRLTVQGGDNAVQCLGGNNRFNSFTLDGVQSNDAFGLNASGLPARANFPIPFDAIRQTAVEFAPYDVEYGQFTGCNINIVTKSGSNEFSGAAFAVFNSQSLTGSTIDGNTVSDTPFRDYNWGASIGGPIIKDKLFFFVAYEEINDGGTIINDGPEDLSFADPIAGLTSTDLNDIANILNTSYGIDATGTIASVIPEESRRISSRIDYFITDNHRFEATYSRERENEVETDDFGFAADFSFLESFENSGSRNEFYSARLFSDWTDNFSTEIRVSRRDNEDIQNPVGGGEAQDANPIPRIFVNVNGNDVQAAGPGQFRSANALVTQTDQLKAKFDYITGSHKFTGGYELNHLDVFNLFAVNATGTIEFDSIADLAAGNASFIEGTGSFSGDINDAAAEFSRNIHTLYFQDEWTPTDALSVVLGLRYDFYTSGDTPTQSQAFVDRYGFSNSVGFNNLEILMPRLGINYDAGDTLFGTTQFRAGAGVFSGGDPTVWFSNAYTNFGGGLGEGDSGGGTCTPADLQVLSGGSFSGIPSCVIDQQQAEAALGAGRLDAIDPDFDIPSIVRGSFGLTHNTSFDGAAGGFFDDWRVDVDVIYSRRRNAPNFIDLTLAETGILTPDGRPLLNAIDPTLAGCDAVFQGVGQGFAGGDTSQGGPCDAGGDDQDILLTNVEGPNGGSLSVSAIFGKRFDYVTPGFEKDGFARFNFGYSYTRARDQNPSTSSTATSNFENVAVPVPNVTVLAPSQFQNAHNVSFSATFGQDIISDLTSSISLFLSARSGSPFSYTFDGDTGEDLFGDSDDEERILLYVPTGPDDPNVTGAGLTPEFFAFLDQTGLSQYAGGVAPRNAFRDPWFVDLDFRFQQELPTFSDRIRSIFYVDIENLPNLFSDSSNVLQRFDRGSGGNDAVPVVTVNELDPVTGAFVFDDTSLSSEITGGDGFDTFLNASLWQVQFGLRFEF